MAAMVQHYATIRRRPGLTVIGTLCNRTNKQCDDGYNSTEAWEAVTCKLCLKMRSFEEKRQAAALSKASGRAPTKGE